MANRKFGFLIIAYPESMNKDALQWIENNFPCKYILHDKDIDDKGNLKKAHYHFVFYGRLTNKQKELIMRMLGINYGYDANSLEDAVYYLTHENHTDKYHYSLDDVHTTHIWKDVVNDEFVLKRDFESEMLQIIYTEDFYEFDDVIQYLMGTDLELLHHVMNKSYFYTRLLDSRRNRNNLKNGGI